MEWGGSTALHRSEQHLTGKIAFKTLSSQSSCKQTRNWVTCNHYIRSVALTQRSCAEHTQTPLQAKGRKEAKTNGVKSICMSCETTWVVLCSATPKMSRITVLMSAWDPCQVRRWICKHRLLKRQKHARAERVDSPKIEITTTDTPVHMKWVGVWEICNVKSRVICRKDARPESVTEHSTNGFLR